MNKQKFESASYRYDSAADMLRVAKALNDPVAARLAASRMLTELHRMYNMVAPVSKSEEKTEALVAA